MSTHLMVRGPSVDHMQVFLVSERRPHFGWKVMATGYTQRVLYVADYFQDSVVASDELAPSIFLHPLAKLACQATPPPSRAALRPDSCNLSCVERGKGWKRTLAKRDLRLLEGGGGMDRPVKQSRKPRPTSCKPAPASGGKLEPASNSTVVPLCVITSIFTMARLRDTLIRRTIYSECDCALPPGPQAAEETPPRVAHMCIWAKTGGDVWTQQRIVLI